jgi:hypothetical protein
MYTIFLVERSPESNMFMSDLFGYRFVVGINCVFELWLFISHLLDYIICFYDALRVPLVLCIPGVNASGLVLGVK